MTVPLPLQPLHRLWRLLPARRRRALFALATARLAPRPDRVPPPAAGGLAVAGEVGRASGLGEAARLMHGAVEALGQTAYLVDTGVPVPGEAADPALAAANAARGLATSLPPGVPLLLHVNPPVLPWTLLRLPKPLRRELLRGRRVIGYWLWELPVMPADWAAGLDFVHEVWTASHFTAEAIRGLPGIAQRGIAVRVVGLPLALAPPRPAALGRAAFGLPEGAVVVLVSASVASSFVRKNPLAAIAAFRQAFGDRPDRLLVLKLLHADRHPDDMAAIRAAIGDAANIRVEPRALPPADAHALTACADIVLSLHRSEGFGLVPAEAMLLGRAVVATGWSGNMDFMDADTAALVPWRLIPAVDPRGIYAVPGAMWAEPEIGAAAAHLSRLADDAEARRALGARARIAAQARLGADGLAAAMRGLGLPAGLPAAVAADVAA